MAKPTTIRELRDSGYSSRSVKQELRDNLIARLRRGEGLFSGIVGYEQTVVPQIENAVLSGQDIVFLGERGQAKTRMARLLVGLLDDEMPALAGCEISDEPFAPICSACRQRVGEQGDRTPIAWIPRDRRYGEKLATPDITIADLIGEVDPIKVAEGRYLSDELTIHYGLLPRTNRGIFALNELPDLAGKVQVGLFNVMQEGDVQIKGYPVRLPLDVLLVFTANPEDYTARGKIITPLKDRIGSEILTHYPASVDLGMTITKQEAWVERDHRPVRVPDFIAELVERIAFEARTDRRIDRRSGVSQRLPITVMENVISNAERRSVTVGDEEVVPRVSDIYAALPAITGKIELEYEGELVGGAVIARELIRRAADATFSDRAGGVNVDDIIMWFDEGSALLVDDDARSPIVYQGFETVPGLVQIVHDTGLAAEGDHAQAVAGCELVLEALVARKRISRNEAGEYGRAAPEPRRRPSGDLFGPGAG